MKIPQKIEETVEKLATLHLEIRENEAIVLDWLEARGIYYDDFSELDCAFANIQDGDSSSFLDCLHKLNSKTKEELMTDYYKREN